MMRLIHHEDGFTQCLQLKESSAAIIKHRVVPAHLVHLDIHPHYEGKYLIIGREATRAAHLKKV